MKTNLDPVPDVRLPDANSPRRRRAGVLLLLSALITASVCALTFGAGWLSGAFSIISPSAPPTSPSSTLSTLEPTPATTAPPAITTAPTEVAAPTVAATDSLPPSTPTKVSAQTTQRQKRVLNTFTRLVRERYVYADFNGMNWDTAMRDDETRVRNGLSDDDFYTMLADRIEQLGDEHSAYLSPKEAQDEDKEYAGELVYAGVGVVTFPLTHTDGLAVLQVFEDSPAAAVGIQPHDRILAINGQPAVDPEGFSNATLFRGDIGTSVRAVIRSPNGAERTVEMMRAEIQARERIESRMLTSGSAHVGYIMVSTLFEESIDEQMREALESLQAEHRLDGLILDLRINGGGALDVLQPALGYFTRGAIGSLYDRSAAKERIIVQAENVGASQKIPLIVLIGPATESYAEVFAAALQENRGAVLIGERTAGNIETLRSHEFEDGSRLWLAEQSFRLPSGKSWEGAGLEPDMLVSAQWHEYTADDDPLIAAALETFP